MKQLAFLGGDPIFSQKIEIVSPKLPRLDQISAQLDRALTSGQLTNQAYYVPIFEALLANRFQVPHAVTVSNATLGITLAMEALHKDGEVILPSYTYVATAHAIYWNRLKPVFVDILPDTFTLDPKAVESAISPRTVAIMPVHIYGHPCEVDELDALSQRYGIPVIYDAAHAFGSQYHGCSIGQFGYAEVFSFHATKVFPVGEGGCTATRNKEMAEFVALARKFGDPGNENTLFPGTNAKMQEFNAIVGLEMLKVVDQHIANRRQYAAYLIERLGRIPGIRFQTIRPYVYTNYQNFAILVEPIEFGLTRDQLFDVLMADNINPRKYFFPPLHWHEAYREYRDMFLPVTEQVSQEVLCLPFYSEMSMDILEGICEVIEQAHTNAPLIREIGG